MRNDAWNKIFQSEMSKSRYFIICLYILVCCELKPNHQASESSIGNLKLVKAIVLFRHGMRAPLRKFKFDPYAEFDRNLWPEGFGELVKEGKDQMYQLGKRLCERYEHLLVPDRNAVSKDVQMVTTAVDRCYHSGAFVLSGFYPQDQEQIRNEDFLRQPISISIRSHSADKVHIIGEKEKCPRYHEELMEVYEITKNDTNFNYLINFLSNFTHSDDIKSAYDVFHVGDYIRTKKLMNLKLPDWISDDFLHRLDQFYVDSSNSLTYNAKMRHLLAGPLINDISNRIQDAIYNRPNNSKFFFYSGHDASLASLFAGLNMETDFVPTYGASFIFEVYRSSPNNYLIKILFSHDYTLNHINVKILPDCEEYCPMGKFVQLIEKYITQDWEVECNL
ncbi:testicular acid phosphatase homolog isoform X2 [Planococcus citri]|uniref:testicular acid phosphatase homolog isoform X2 n=1 Tax=Planococcus citri TaxID=170843 RepID=UPI0031FA2F4F